MTLLGFIAALISALAWPTAVIVLLLMLRKSILPLLPNLKRLKLSGVELEFREELEATRVVANATLVATAPPRVIGPPQTPAALDESLQSRVARIAAVSPRAAISEAWVTLENAIRQRWREGGYPPAGSFGQSTLDLWVREVIDEKTEALIRRLRQLRNKAVHAGDDLDLTVAEALEYGTLVQDVITALAQVPAER